MLSVRFLCLLALALAASPSSSPAQTDTTWYLHDGDITCVFNGGTATIENAYNGKVLVSGEFAGACGSTPYFGPSTAQVTASSTNINAGQNITLTWSGHGDVCHTHGSVLPSGAVTGWPITWVLCVKDANCSQPHTIQPTLTVPGTYTFRLTCVQGANANTSGDQATQQAVVHVY